MKKPLLILFVSFLCIPFLMAETSIKGTVKSADTQNPIPGAIVTLMGQNLSTQTNAEGQFSLRYIDAGDLEIRISKIGYFTQIKLIHVDPDKENDLGTFYLREDIQQETKQEVVLQLSENQIDEDEGRATQNISAALSSKGDVYVSQTSYAFSPMRFRARGYDDNFESTYINGVYFNSIERGGFNYSSLGGLNDAMRNQDYTYGFTPNTFSYGNLGGTTNINTKASNYAAGTKASVAYTNRSYKLRGQATYATGLMQNGWAFAGSAVVRWADKGIVDGTFYNSWGYFFSAEKILNKQHSLSFVTFGSPTQRAQQGAVTQEVFDLAGSIYYNPYWGYQEGEIRNSRIVKSFDPTAILSHEFKISNNQLLRTGLAFHYSLYSNSALNFYNAPDPRPDYYRNLPSFVSDDSLKNVVANQWKSDTNVSQVNWNALYQANYKNNAINPNGTARYSVERRHNDLMEGSFNSTYTQQVNKQLKLIAGIEGKMSKGMHYKTLDDLLGGNQWIDIDQFSERDFPSNPDIIQNDLKNRNAVIKENDIFGYNYDINMAYANAFIQNEWILPQFDIYYAGKLTYTQFYRYGHMQNGRAPENSYGKSKTWYFVDPSLKAGFTYKIDGHNRLSFNGLIESRAPLASQAYLSERIKDTLIPYLQSQDIRSADINYNFTYSTIRGRIGVFQTNLYNTSDMLGYYDDEYRTFINHVLAKSDKVYKGVELGTTVKINSNFSVSLAGTYADYHYANNAIGVKSPENGAFADVAETVLTKGLKIAAGPQAAGNITIDYFHPKMWFADVTLNYFDNNYLDFAPNRFTENNMAKYTTPEMMAALGTQEKLKGGFLLDASIGKLIYLKHRRSLNFNFSASNILNNTKMITGGYQQARLPLTNGAIDPTGLDRFPNKYYYAWGFNVFFNIGYKF